MLTTKLILGCGPEGWVVSRDSYMTDDVQAVLQGNVLGRNVKEVKETLAALNSQYNEAGINLVVASWSGQV